MEPNDTIEPTVHKDETINMHDDLGSDVNKVCDFAVAVGPLERCGARVPDHLLSHVLPFCDPSDYISALEASKPFFAKALQLCLSSHSSLSLSFLLKKFPNSSNNHSGQENAVSTLLSSSILSARKVNRSVRLKRIEFANLRAITGESFLLALKNVPLVTIDFTNCIRLDPRLLLEYLLECPTTLQHLSLNGCTQVGSDVVETIMERHTQLMTLSLASCSQSLRADACLSKLPLFRQLKHLDLRGLKHISDESISLIDLLPESLQSIDFSGCEQVRMLSLEAQRKMHVYLERSQQYVEAAEVRIANINNILENNGDSNRNARAVYPGILQDNPEVFIWKNEPTSRQKIRHLFLDGVASPRRGLCRGIVAYFAHGRCLQEVHLAGCEHVGDWEIAALAVTCGDTLTCFQMRAGKIGNLALKALARHCHVLGEIDVSACFGVGDDGIVALCGPRDRRQRHSDVESQSPERKRRRLVKSSLKALKVASLPKLTDRGIRAIANLKSLLVLDVHDCPEVTPPALQKTLHSLPNLIDVNAKDISTGEGTTLPTLLRNDQLAPRNLKFVNQRVFVSSVHDTSSSLLSSRCELKNCCTVQRQSQRLSSTIPLQMMFHCVDCQLIPSLDRGVCENCVATCHKGHKTFLGSYTRFYCDCPFGLNAELDCKAIASSCINLEIEAS
jgi:hypothetical protein